MTGVEVAFSEAAGLRTTDDVPLAHVSVELGHLYAEDFAGGPERLRAHFARVRPWVDAVRAAADGRAAGGRARMSTCFLVDDYFTPFSSPAELVPQLLDAARAVGVEIDYLARESGCATAHGVPLAQLVEGRLVADPAPGTTGARPPATENGWLCNGQRSPVATASAMSGAVAWVPPVQNGARNHSVFLDVELRSGAADSQRWSCAFLATVWQLLRLGLLRNDGRSVADAVPWDGALPDVWGDLPPLLRLRAGARAFSAYRTFSILAPRFLDVEHAVRTVLAQVAIDEDVRAQVRRRARTDDPTLPVEVVDRLGYLFDA